MTSEIWKDIVGYERLYQISNLGRVKSLVRNQIKKSCLSNSGYLQVFLYKNYNKKVRYIHRLVAEKFVDNHNNLPQVNHINGIKTDNASLNLEWVTPSQNMRHAHDNGLVHYPCRNGEKNPKSKLTEKQVIDIYIRIKNGEKNQVLCEEYGISKHMVSKIKLGKTWGYLTKGLVSEVRKNG